MMNGVVDRYSIAVSALTQSPKFVKTPPLREMLEDRPLTIGHSTGLPTG